MSSAMAFESYLFVYAIPSFSFCPRTFTTTPPPWFVLFYCFMKTRHERLYVPDIVYEPLLLRNCLSIAWNDIMPKRKSYYYTMSVWRCCSCCLSCQRVLIIHYIILLLSVHSLFMSPPCLLFILWYIKSIHAKDAMTSRHYAMPRHHVARSANCRNHVIHTIVCRHCSTPSPSECRCSQHCLPMSRDEREKAENGMIWRDLDKWYTVYPCLWEEYTRQFKRKMRKKI